MIKKRLPRLDPPTKPFKIDGVPSGMVELLSHYIEMKAWRENKTEAQILEDMLLPIVTKGITQESVERNLRNYNRTQERIRKVHEEATAQELPDNLPE